jgi:hypothetical protein
MTMKQEFEATLNAVGDPHALWMSLMPDHYATLSDEAKMDHVGLIVDFVHYAIEIRNAKIPDITKNLVERRHFELALMTGLLIKYSKLYQQVFKLYGCREFSGADVWLRYALLVALPITSTTEFHATLQKIALEIDMDLFVRYFHDPNIKFLVEHYK